MDQANFERSDIVKQIITRKPGFAEKWALWVVLFTLLLIFLGSSFVKYPVKIKVSGNIDSVFSVNGASGKKYIANISLTGDKTYTISTGQKVLLLLSAYNVNKTYMPGYIKHVSNFDKQKNMEILVNLNDQIFIKYPKIVAIKDQPAQILITTDQYSLMQMFYHTTLQNIKF